MKALFYNFQNKKFILKEASVPKIKSDEVLIKIKSSSLCGSDLHIIDGPLTLKVYNKKEIILGHSFSGIVEKTGKAVKNFKKGDRVFASNFVWCGKCQKCKEGNENLCDNRYIFGMEIPGAHAQYLKAPKRILFHLPKEIGFEAGSLITDVFTLNFHAVKKVNPRPKDKIAILGAGPIGLASGILLKAVGIKYVFLVEPIKYRQNLAKKLFNPKIIQKKNIAEFFGKLDIVFEASGSHKALNLAYQLLNRGGKLAVIGVHDRDFRLNTLKLVSRELSIFGVFHYTKHDVKNSLDLIKKNNIDLGKLITHKFALKDGEEAYELLKNKKAGRIVILTD